MFLSKIDESTRVSSKARRKNGPASAAAKR
jgi:hypothetical protein